MSRLTPLPIDQHEALAERFAFFEQTLGFVPNSLLTMQRKPKLVDAFIQFSAAVYDPDGEVDLGFKRLVAHVASSAAGCQYCKAHTAVSAKRHGIPVEKLEDVWNYRESPHYSEAERVALDFALAAASQPNDVTDELFALLRTYWSEDAVVEMLSVIGLFGFFNRWNDSLATPLEVLPMETAQVHLTQGGWEAGKHMNKG
ncbi:MAG: peroxidase [gamma proteobacterium symbiont of Stewartia floridana]|nr:carboxymuconolactone decarboxylase family protein [Candidatus Thiodiazotropha taylori]MCG8014913.1 carboxymuconolactone decarboxylase family protein [Candidatus Thiodiazotropha sp. 'RUGA']RLW52243.1 MAG: peroxidase [gamma proteobacterium symbiont of Stewartia floridana]MCG7870265.1 carboxymuconolactone decarboxylase family protein [Candidatus Thiodiazotropha taylori]MCG7907723.1 carboxymuconolactone decarboxylase family protein [Candidatus Thiodiazotropha taylori]